MMNPFPVVRADLRNDRIGAVAAILLLTLSVAFGAWTPALGGVLFTVLAPMRRHRRGLAILRALGAPRAYIFLVAWCRVTLVITAGAAFGFAGAFAVDSRSAALAGTVIAAGMALAVIPVFATYRKSVAAAFRG